MEDQKESTEQASFLIGFLRKVNKDMTGTIEEAEFFFPLYEKLANFFEKEPLLADTLCYGRPMAEMISEKKAKKVGF